MMPVPDLPDLTDETIRASGIAHAIRLGKRPAVGMVMGFSLQLEEREAEDIEHAINAPTLRTVTDKVPYEFVVTEEDIRRAEQLINEQQIRYREPKTSVLKLRP